MKLNMSKFSEAKNLGRSIKPKISISVNGVLGFNKASIKIFQIEENSYIKVFYNKEDSMIAVKILKEKEGGSSNLRVSEKVALASIIGFLKYFEIDTSKTKTFDLHRDEENEVLWFDLKQGTIKPPRLTRK